MNNKETVQTLMDAIQNGDFVKAKTLLTDDFKFSGPVPEPISREAWLKMSVSLRTAFPDLNYHFKVEGEDGDTVKISSGLTGTHKGNFDLTAMGMGVIPATNKFFTAQREHGQSIMQDGKVKTWEMQKTEGAGVMAILDQLGVKVPVM